MSSVNGDATIGVLAERLRARLEQVLSAEERYQLRVSTEVTMNEPEQRYSASSGAT